MDEAKADGNDLGEHGLGSESKETLRSSSCLVHHLKSSTSVVDSLQQSKEEVKQRGSIRVCQGNNNIQTRDVWSSPGLTERQNGNSPVPS